MQTEAYEQACQIIEKDVEQWLREGFLQTEVETDIYCNECGSVVSVDWYQKHEEVRRV